ncbi:MAG: hypothetical protein EP319_03750 [Deltaproteobacteria bacterium]|nr:MAG: hypothetical protein EP319_03750 [Deltaproteobacteria bacterium]
MKKFFLLILLFFLNSCQEYSQFNEVNGTITILPTESKIEDIQIVKWRVGPRRKQLVSKGIEIRMKFPILSSESLEHLIEKSNVNAWLVTIRRNNLVREEVMERAFIPLVIPGTDKSRYKARIRQMKNGYVRVFYADAAVSHRFADFSCPAFKHNKLITSVQIEEIAPQNSPIILSPHRKDKILAKVNEFSYQPEPVNGEKSLEGRYSIEIALYNSKTKTVLSNSYRYAQYAVVENEKEVPITGCENFEIPDIKEGGGIKDFKFGR